MKITINRPVEVDAKFLKVDAGVRYWEDAKVNGISDNENPPTIPCAEFLGDKNHILIGQNYRWRPLIDIDAGQIINWEQGVTANVHYKVCDDGIYTVMDENNHVIAEHEGYVSNIMCPTDDGYGDYIIMDIDENGFIQGWNKRLIDNLVEQAEED